MCERVGSAYTVQRTLYSKGSGRFDLCVRNYSLLVNRIKVLLFEGRGGGGCPSIFARNLIFL